MFSFLKDHPFAVESYFENSIVLSFAIPKEHLQNLIPECLTLDTFQDKWAFIAVALVKTKNLRPKGFPEFLGNDFKLIGYRIFVRYKNNAGKNLRGLYILKSETDKRKMEFLGNLFTHYNYTTTDILVSEVDNSTEIQSLKSNFKFNYTQSENEISLPENSPFGNWQEARKFAGPLPFTFSFKKEKNEVLIIEGVRENWVPNPIKVHNFHFEFLEPFYSKGLVLANAFMIKDIPYFWKKGKIESWK